MPTLEEDLEFLWRGVGVVVANADWESFISALDRIRSALAARPAPMTPLESPEEFARAYLDALDRDECPQLTVRIAAQRNQCGCGCERG